MAEIDSGDELDEKLEPVDLLPLLLPLELPLLETDPSESLLDPAPMELAAVIDCDDASLCVHNGRTHLAHKAEHAVDLDTGAIVAVFTWTRCVRT